MPPHPTKIETEPLKSIQIYGLLSTIDYQKVKCCANVKKKNRKYFKKV
jgi:hypothetical protein